MNSYVKRERNGRVSWTGPIRSERQAIRESRAWHEAGWQASVVPSSPEVRAEVRAWERAKREAVELGYQGLQADAFEDRLV